MDCRESRWTRIEEGNLTGLIDRRLGSILEARFFEELDRRVVACGGRILKDSRVRWVAVLPLEGGKALHIKKFRTVGRWQFVKDLVLSSRAMREWLISCFLLGQGIQTPTPLGVIEKRRHGVVEECIFLADSLEGASDLFEFCRNRFKGPHEAEGRTQILRLLATTVRQIHDSRIFHSDLHAGNFLIVHEGPLSLYLIDLHHARKGGRVSKRKRLWNIAQIFNSLDFMLDREAKGSFLRTYEKGQAPFGSDLGVCLRRVERMVQKMAKRRQRSRAKRCLKESTLFTIGQRAGLKIFRRREVEEEDLLGILNAHREMVSKSPEKLIKDSPKTIVSIVGESEANGRRVCVKQYRYGTVLDQLSNSLRRPRGKVSWVAGNALFGKGISLLKPLAYVEKRKLRILQKAFYVTESMDDNLEMDRYLVQRFEGHPKHDLRRFIRQFAEWIGSLHRAGIYHRDLKTCNILVREVSNGWEFSLVDLEDVVQGVTIGIEKILKNLVQINCSIPRSVSYGDRVRFMKGYFKANPVAVDDRALIVRILVESRRRGIVYVSPTGVVVEEFE